MKMSKWVPTTDLMMLRRMGKLQEEMSELGSVAARCIIQGIDEIDPSSGRVNRERLWTEIADVYAQLDETVSRLGLNTADIETRRAEKRGYMQEWEAMFAPECATCQGVGYVHRAGGNRTCPDCVQPEPVSADAEDAERYRFAYDGSDDFAICRWDPTGGPDHDGDWVSTSEDVIDAARKAKGDAA